MQLLLFVPALVSACIRIVRVRASTEEESSVEDYVNLKTMILSTTSGKEKIKDSLAIRKEREPVAEKNKEKEKEKEEEKEQEKEGKSELEAAAHNADTVLLRQSALSLLADAVVSAKWIASKYLTDILDIATHVPCRGGKGHTNGAGVCTGQLHFLELKARTCLFDFGLGSSGRRFASGEQERKQQKQMGDFHFIQVIEGLRGLNSLSVQPCP